MRVRYELLAKAPFPSLARQPATPHLPRVLVMVPHRTHHRVELTHIPGRMCHGQPRSGWVSPAHPQRMNSEAPSATALQIRMAGRFIGAGAYEPPRMPRLFYTTTTPRCYATSGSDLGQCRAVAEAFEEFMRHPIRWWLPEGAAFAVILPRQLARSIVFRRTFTRNLVVCTIDLACVVDRLKCF